MLSKKKGYVNLKVRKGSDPIRDGYQFTRRNQIVQYSGRKRKKTNSGSDLIPVSLKDSNGQETVNWISFLTTTVLSAMGIILVVILDVFHLRGNRNGEQLT